MSVSPYQRYSCLVRKLIQKRLYIRTISAHIFHKMRDLAYDISKLFRGNTVPRPPLREGRSPPVLTVIWFSALRGPFAIIQC